MRFVIGSLVVLMNLADNATTYLCLRAPVEGWEVSEANPLADWLFQTLGLVPGIALDSAVTLVALGLLMVTTLIPDRAKIAFLGVIVVWTAYAVVNNLQAIQALGLSPLGA